MNIFRFNILENININVNFYNKIFLFICIELYGIVMYNFCLNLLIVMYCVF